MWINFFILLRLKCFSILSTTFCQDSLMAASHWTKEEIYGNLHVVGGFLKTLLRKAAFCWCSNAQIVLCIGIPDGIFRVFQYFMSLRFVHAFFQNMVAKVSKTTSA
jgi:hypothetical protein